jgi:predicted  nucleic acid-binding Zn-ribbon protein
VDDDDRQDAERELMHLNGEMAKLMDQISDLEATDDLDPSQERLLEDLKNDEEGIDRAIQEVEDRL